jgi:hypothetical protein
MKGSELSFNRIYFNLFILHTQMCTVNFCPLIQYLGLHFTAFLQQEGL